MKRHLIFTGLVLPGLGASMLTAAAFAASAPDYTAVQKDLNILTNILRTATQPEKSDSRHWRSDSPDIKGMYLAHQGMVITVEAHDRHWNFGFRGPIAPLPPMPPSVSYSMNGEVHEIEMPDSAELDEAISEAMESVSESMREYGLNSSQNSQWQKDMAELRESVKKTAKEYREWQKKFAESSKAKSMSEKEKQQMKESLDKSRAAFDQSRKTYQAKAESFRAEANKKRNAQIEKLESTLLDALCSYAGSTRRLSNDEHVSLIVKEAGSDEEKDRIWVIKKTLLDQCVGKVQENGFLRKNGISYES